MTGKPVRVLVVTPRYPPAIGGVERHVERLARGLAARGLDVEVATTDSTARRASADEVEGIPVHREPTLVGGATFSISPRLAAYVARHVDRFDLVHIHSYHTPVALTAAAACRRSSLPYVFTPHYHGTGHTPLRRLLHVPYRVPGRWLVRRATRLICVTEAEASLLTTHFGPGLRIAVIPNGVDATPRAPQRGVRARSGEVTILSVGRLEHYKGTARLVEAIAALPTQYRLVVIGDGPARETIERTVARLRLGSRVRLCGHVAADVLQGWYRDADVFASLSSHESFGVTLIEAGAVGLPVLATDIPAHREVVRYLPADGYRLVGASSTAAEVAAALGEIARRGPPREAAVASLPTWDALVDRVVLVYEDALTEAGSDAVATSAVEPRSDLGDDPVNR